MSTLSTLTPRTTSDVDSRFDALVRSAVPMQREPGAGENFENVFDLDYGQDLVPCDTDVVPVRAPRSVRPTRASAAASRRATPRASRAVRLTRRGRTVLVLAFVALTLAVMTAFGGWATATLGGGTPEPVRVIEVAPGQTLYGIAAELAKPGEIRAMVHRIQELNSLPGGQITEGQKLAIPRG